MSDLPQSSIAVVLGTRPEIVKLAEIVRLLGPAARIIHTGQHYDRSLASVFFEDLDVVEPAATLGVGGSSRGLQIGAGVSALDELFARDRPRAVVVQGDTNATVAGSIAANAREVPLVHIEAGLRSHDRAMPEEHNRVLADHLADLCCAPTEVNRKNLAAEGISGDRVVVTGNTVVEAVTRALPPAESRAPILERFGVEAGRFALSTLHRPENVDQPGPLRAILTELARISLPVLLPLHPRTVARVEEFGLQHLLHGVRVVAPVAYPQFLALFAESALAVTDSGGLAEEASVLKRPVIVVRNSTERPEVMGTFATLVPAGPAIGTAVESVLEDLSVRHERLAALPSPYGDGSASRRSVAAIEALLGVRA